MTEIDVISHLVEIEHQAAELLLDTQIEADRRTTEAKTKATAEYKERYESIIKELEAQYIADASSIDKKHNSVMEDYKHAIDCTQVDTDKFNQLLDKLLFAK